MKILIDKLKLELLLEKKRDYINRNIDGLDVMISAILYIVSLLCSDFRNLFGVNHYVWETIAWVLAIMLLFYGMYLWIKSRKLKYNHEILCHDIENLNEVVHAFSIVAIKDTFQEFSNRFLLYYDKAWECWFFFSIKTSDTDNEKFVQQKISNQLKIDRKKIHLQYISDRIQPKYSERDKVNKVYQHSLYLGEIYQFSEELQKSEFVIDGIQYRWWTIEEMESDDNIMNKNRDVVAYVKEKIS